MLATFELIKHEFGVHNLLHVCKLSLIFRFGEILVYDLMAQRKILLAWSKVFKIQVRIAPHFENQKA